MRGKTGMYYVRGTPTLKLAALIGNVRPVIPSSTRTNQHAYAYAPGCGQPISRDGRSGGTRLPRLISTPGQVWWKLMCSELCKRDTLNRCPLDKQSKDNQAPTHSGFVGKLQASSGRAELMNFVMCCSHYLKKSA
jgi:hypothetical protein